MMLRNTHWFWAMIGLFIAQSLLLIALPAHGAKSIQVGSYNYGLIMPEDSPLRERINQALLKVRSSEQWQASLTEYRLQ
jgi:ABC-type amino acid transport substrate-binding protein